MLFRITVKKNTLLGIMPHIYTAPVEIIHIGKVNLSAPETRYARRVDPQFTS